MSHESGYFLSGLSGSSHVASTAESTHAGKCFVPRNQRTTTQSSIVWNSSSDRVVLWRIFFHQLWPTSRWHCQIPCFDVIKEWKKEYGKKQDSNLDIFKIENFFVKKQQQKWCISRSIQNFDLVKSDWTPNMFRLVQTCLWLWSLQRHICAIVIAQLIFVVCVFKFHSNLLF